MIQPTPKTIAWLVGIHGGDPVVIPCSEGLLEGDELFFLVHEISNPVLLVR